MKKTTLTLFLFSLITFCFSQDTISGKIYYIMGDDTIPASNVKTYRSDTTRECYTVDHIPYIEYTIDRFLETKKGRRIGSCTIITRSFSGRDERKDGAETGDQ
jgi:hypothetical protein